MSAPADTPKTHFDWPVETCPDCQGRLPHGCNCGKK